MRKLTDTEVADLLKSEVPWNVARRVLSNATCSIARANENKLMSPIEYRRMEFEAVAEIAAVFGVALTFGGMGFDLEPPAADPNCPHCQGKGTVWRGGQGGDYEICDCRSRPKRRIEEARAEIERGARTGGEPFRLAQEPGAAPAGKPPGSPENVP